MRNKANFSAADLAVVFNENNLINIKDDFNATGISTDSRTVTKGNIFVALKGENADAHNFVSQAVKRGASAVVVHKEWYENNPINSPVITVDDTLESLGEFAHYHRMRFDIPLICVGGSNGKTTTKEMIAAIFSKKHKTLKTYRNYNNRIGVPLMLLQLDESYEAAVIEIATNQPGEISLLTEIAAPTYGIITNIGKEHLEQLMDLRGVELEETYLFGYLRSKGICLINIDDEILQKYTKVLDNYITFGLNEHAQVKGSIDINEELQTKLKIDYRGDSFLIHLKTFGYINAINALASVSVALVSNIEPELIIEALESYETDQQTAYGRMRIEKVKDIILINDCYNANPASMRMALDTLKSYIYTRKRIAILGDMLELGHCSESEHINLLKYAENRADIIALFGNEFKNAQAQSPENNKLFHFVRIDDLMNFITEVPASGDLLLVKGSRGMRLERIIEHLKS